MNWLLLLLVAVAAVLSAYWLLPPVGTFGVQQ
jgi:hypothetical protein